MALFVKRPILGDSASLYTTGLEKTLLIVGLGNVGKEYDDTRHNIGFEIVDFFAGKQDFPAWTANKDRACQETATTIGSAKVILCKPTTLMNLSGNAVMKTQNYYKIPNSATLVIHDEADIDFGQLRTRKGGSAAGHNGIKSIIKLCGEDFSRLRVGIGPKQPAQIELSDFVLNKFPDKQKKQLNLLLLESNSLLSEYCYGGGELLEETRGFLI